MISKLAIGLLLLAHMVYAQTTEYGNPPPRAVDSSKPNLSAPELLPIGGDSAVAPPTNGEASATKPVADTLALGNPDSAASAAPAFSSSTPTFQNVRKRKVQFVFQGALGFSNLSMNKDFTPIHDGDDHGDEESILRPDFRIGILVPILPASNTLFLKPGFGFALKGGDLPGITETNACGVGCVNTFQSFDVKYRFNYIVLPVILGASFASKTAEQFSLGLGPSINFLASASKEEEGEEFDIDWMNTVDFCIRAEAEYAKNPSPSVGIGFGAFFERSLVKADNTEVDPVTGEELDEKMKNITFGIQINVRISRN